LSRSVNNIPQHNMLGSYNSSNMGIISVVVQRAEN